MAYYIVSSGGTSIIGTHNAWDSMTIIDGGSVNGREIQSSGYLGVSSGGYANNIQICYNGSMYVFSGGKADNTAVKADGSMFVYSGGIANKTNVYGWGTFNVSSGGIVNSAIVSGGSMYVSSGGIANETIVSSGSMYVFSGGIADNTIVSTGFLYVSSGATATNIDWTPGKGHVYVLDGGTATFVSQYSGVYYGTGEQFSHALVMEDKTVVRSKEMNVMSGGTAINTTVNESGYLYVSSGGTANSTTVSFEGRMYISSGGVADNTFLYGAPFTWYGDWGLFISSGGTANGTVVSGGHLYVSSGGTATNIIWTPCEGHVNVSFGGYVTFASQYSGVYYGSGKHLLSNTSVLEDAMVSSYCDLYAMSGGVANRASVNISGNMYVCSGGVANSTMVNESGYLCVSSGGTANNTVLNDDEHMIGGRMQVFNGGLANSTMVKTNGSYGGLFVFSDGVVSHTLVHGHGKLSVLSGGIASDTKVYAGGSIELISGAIVTGRMDFAPGAIVFVEHGAVIDFNLTQTSADGKALLSDWSLIQGNPDYTITVNNYQETGIYKLAGVADEFDSTISVQNTLGESLGTLAVGEKITIDDVDYTLNILDDCLTVTVGNGIVPPAADTEAPKAPAGLMPVVDGQNVALLWNESTDDTGVKEYVVKYSLDGEIFTVRTTIPHYVLNDADFGSYSWSVQAVDFAGNESAVSAGNMFTVSNFKTYIVEYSVDNFEHILGLKVNSDALDSFRLPTGTYQSRIRATNSADWTPVEQSIVSLVDKSPMLVKSDEDGNADVFFANPVSTWESGYLAQHAGSINDWAGTNKYAALSGKNKLADIIEGSTDANILLMTDDENGDALFVDDIYTDLPGSIEEQQSRIAQIDEIRAGIGDDIVDMTSQRFEYVGDRLTIRGGAGNDTIWANKGDNKLFGDAGNDRIVGASGNDVIVGGIGSDSMHGGGGNDIFTFCDNWGVDNVEQLATGSVTLWFASGDESNWNAKTMTYADGANNVSVSGVTADRITLKFGRGETQEDTARFAALTDSGAFADFTSERIFEESGKGILASL